jgi:hypothetical protein
LGEGFPSSTIFGSICYYGTGYQFTEFDKKLYMLGVAISPLGPRENEMLKDGDWPFENGVKKTKE